MAGELKTTQMPRVISWVELEEMISHLEAQIREDISGDVVVYPRWPLASIPSYLLNCKLSGEAIMLQGSHPVSTEILWFDIATGNNNEIALFHYNYEDVAKQVQPSKYVFDTIEVPLDHTPPKVIMPWTE